MSKNAILLHGTGSAPDRHWFPWLIAHLDAAGYDIYAPQMPEAERADLSIWTPYVMSHARFNKDTIMIGHSAGCPLILNILQQLKRPIRKSVLVGGFAKPLPNMAADHQTVIQNPDWAKMRENGGEFTFFNSDDDPWGCTIAEGEFMRQHLGGTLVAMTGQGHFGSAVFNQVYTEFPLLLSVCLNP